MPKLWKYWESHGNTMSPTYRSEVKRYLAKYLKSLFRVPLWRYKDGKLGRPHYKVETRLGSLQSDYKLSREQVLGELIEQAQDLKMGYKAEIDEIRVGIKEADEGEFVPLSESNPYATKEAMRRSADSNTAVHLAEKAKWQVQVAPSDVWEASVTRMMAEHKDTLDKLAETDYPHNMQEASELHHAKKGGTND